MSARGRLDGLGLRKSVGGAECILLGALLFIIDGRDDSYLLG